MIFFSDDDNDLVLLFQVSYLELALKLKSISSKGHLIVEMILFTLTHRDMLLYEAMLLLY